MQASPPPADDSQSRGLTRVARALLALSLLALIASLILFVAGAPIRDSVLLPLARRMSSDGILTPGFVARLDGMRLALGKAAVAAALGLGSLAVLWETACRRLPPEIDSGDGRGGRWVLPAVPDLLVIAAGGCMLAWGFHGFIGSGLEYDELFSKAHFFDAPTSWEAATRYLVFNNHIGYTHLARASSALLGGGEASLRMPAAVFGLLSLPLCWILARQVGGRLVAALSVLLLAASPALAHWSASARGYSGMVFFSLASTIALLCALRRPTRGAAVALALSTGFGAYVHFFTGFVTLVQGLHLAFLVVRESRRPAGERRLSASAFRSAAFGLCGGVVLALLLHGPVLHRLLAEVLVRTSDPGAGFLPVEVIASFGGDGGLAAMVPLLALAVAGVLLGDRQTRDTRTLLALLAFLPVFMAAGMGVGGLYPRFFIFSMPPLLILAAAGTAELAARIGARAGATRGWTTAAASIALAAVAAYPVARSLPLSRVEKTVREACAWLQDGVAVNETPCVVGDDVFLTDSYGGKGAKCLRTVADLERVLESRRPVRCLWIPVTGTREAFAELLTRLESGGTRRDWNGVVLFRVE